MQLKHQTQSGAASDVGAFEHGKDRAKAWFEQLQTEICASL